MVSASPTTFCLNEEIVSIAKNTDPAAVKIVTGAPNAVCATKKIVLMSKTIVFA
jgi:hypothetical protein